MMQFRKYAALFVAMAALLAAPAMAQDYPNRRLTMIVGFAAGSGADILTRYYATKLSEALGQTVVVENKPGANGNIAAVAAKQAKPDGYTIFFSPSAAMSGGKFLYANLGYDSQKDYIIAAPLLDVAFTLAVGANSPVKSIAELTALLKSKPNARYGTSNSTGLAATQVYKTIAGFEAQQVAYKTTADAIPDLADGTLDFMFIDGTFGVGQHKAGKIRLLATTSSRIDSVPEVPTMREAGVGNYSFTVWFMIMVPTGTPPEVVTKLNEVFTKINQTEETRKFLSVSASVPLTGTPDQMAKKLDDDIKVWAELAKDGNIVPQ